MQDFPEHILDKAYKAGLTRHDNPIILEDGTKIRTALHDWDELCKNNTEKSLSIEQEMLCVQLAMRAHPYELGVGIELATMGEKWEAALKLMSQFYDRNQKLFKLWVKINSIPTPFFLQYLAEFELLFQQLKTYKKLEAFINILIAVYNKTEMLYNNR